MVQKEIEETYEEVVVETEEETITFCDGCTEQTDDYVTLSNVSPQCLDQTLEHYVNVLDSELATQVHRLKENAETFHLCRGCQKGLREHGRTIDTALYDAPEEDETTDLHGFESRFDVYIFGSSMLLIAFLFLGGLAVAVSNPIGGMGMIVIGVALILALIASPPKNA